MTGMGFQSEIQALGRNTQQVSISSSVSVAFLIGGGGQRSQQGSLCHRHGSRQSWRQSGGMAAKRQSCGMTAWRQSGGMAAWRQSSWQSSGMTAWRHGGKSSGRMGRSWCQSGGLVIWRQSWRGNGGKVAAWRQS
eukprot:gene13791-biopygen3572